MFINGNGEQLNKVFLSLLGNSIYAVHKQAIRKHDQNEAYHPEVTLTVRRIDNHADVIIRDNGTGIEQAIIENNQKVANYRRELVASTPENIPTTAGKGGVILVHSDEE